MQAEQTPLVRAARRNPSLVSSILALSISLLLTSVALLASSSSEAPPFPSSRKSHPQTICDSKDFRKETLKLLSEVPFASIVDINHPERVFEASDVTFRENISDIHVVFDNTFQPARFPFAPNIGPVSTLAYKNMARRYGMLEWPDDDGSDSGFEYIAYNSSSATFLVGQEVHQPHDVLNSRVFEVDFGSDGIFVKDSCIIDYEFHHENKGIEGAAIITTEDGSSYLLALCEGNHCEGGSRGRDSGNGRILVMQREEKDGHCLYTLVSTVHIPSEVKFQDYSALSVWEGRKIAVLSQEESAVFIGDLDLSDGVRVGDGKIYNFPRNDACEIKYCNLEGFGFASETTVVAVSDRMKSKGEQHFRCRDKDESVHVFEY